jgi:hypothetical protein
MYVQYVGNHALVWLTVFSIQCHAYILCTHMHVCHVFLKRGTYICEGVSQDEACTRDGWPLSSRCGVACRSVATMEVLCINFAMKIVLYSKLVDVCMHADLERRSGFCLCPFPLFLKTRLAY